MEDMQMLLSDMFNLLVEKNNEYDLLWLETYIKGLFDEKEAVAEVIIVIADFAQAAKNGLRFAPTDEIVSFLHGGLPETMPLVNAVRILWDNTPMLGEGYGSFDDMYQASCKCVERGIPIEDTPLYMAYTDLFKL